MLILAVILFYLHKFILYNLISDPMKTINLKNTFKVFLFLFVLCSANAFSFTKLPTEASSSGHESRFGCASKTTKVSKKSTMVYAKATKGIAMQTKGKKCFKK